MQKITIIEKGDVLGDGENFNCIVLLAPPMPEQYPESKILVYNFTIKNYFLLRKDQLLQYKYSHNAGELLKEYENKLLKLAKLKNFLKGGKLWI